MPRLSDRRPSSCSGCGASCDKTTPLRPSSTRCMSARARRLVAGDDGAHHLVERVDVGAIDLPQRRIALAEEPEDAREGVEHPRQHRRPRRHDEPAVELDVRLDRFDRPALDGAELRQRAAQRRDVAVARVADGERERLIDQRVAQPEQRVQRLEPLVDRRLLGEEVRQERDLARPRASRARACRRPVASAPASPTRACASPRAACCGWCRA